MLNKIKKKNDERREMREENTPWFFIFINIFMCLTIIAKCKKKKHKNKINNNEQFTVIGKIFKRVFVVICWALASFLLLSKKTKSIETEERERERSTEKEMVKHVNTKKEKFL